MAELLATSTKCSFFLGFLCFNLIFAIDIVEAETDEIDTNSNDDELIFANVVSVNESFKFLFFSTKRLNYSFVSRYLDMVTETLWNRTQLIQIKMKDYFPKDLDN